MNLASVLLAHAADSPSVNRKLKVAGLPIVIEHPKGSQRLLHNDAGEVVYKVHMHYSYGFVSGTKGRDGDEVDVFVGPIRVPKDVFIIHMVDRGPDKKEREDEDKVMLGFPSADAAKSGFLLHYPKSFYGGMTCLPLDVFKKRLKEAQKPHRRKMLHAGRFSNWNSAVKKAKCPKCGGKKFTLMPTDFETAKCTDCKHLFQIDAK